MAAMENTPLLIAALVPALVLAIVCHEVAHGWVALMLGDTTARDRKRLTLNPIRHVDPIGTLLLPGVLAFSGMPVFGWAKPVPVNKRRLRNPRFGMMAVAAAGPGTNLVLAAIGAVLVGLLYRWIGDPALAGMGGMFAYTFLSYFIVVNVFLALFNLLPIPPFDGSHIVEGLLPPPAARVYAKARPYGFFLLFGLLLVLPWLFPEWQIIERFVAPPAVWVLDQIALVIDWVAGSTVPGLE